MRVKWQATVSYEIVVTKPGYLYVWKGNKDTRPQTGLTWEPRPEAVTGPYLPGAYRTLVRAQQRIKMVGYELGLVARRIELKKSD